MFGFKLGSFFKISINFSNTNINYKENNTMSNTPIEIYELRRPFTITETSGDTLIDAVTLDLPKQNGRTQETVVEFYSFLNSAQLRGMVAIQRDIKSNNTPQPDKDNSEPINPIKPTTEELISTFLVQCSYASGDFQSDLVKKFRVLAKKCPEIVTFNSVPLGDLHYNSMSVVDLVNLAAAYSVNFTNA
jgi:hypothetical protein